MIHFVNYQFSSDNFFGDVSLTIHGILMPSKSSMSQLFREQGQIYSSFNLLSKVLGF